jgi:hypothetical protein
MLREVGRISELLHGGQQAEVGAGDVSQPSFRPRARVAKTSIAGVVKGREELAHDDGTT